MRTGMDSIFFNRILHHTEYYNCTAQVAIRSTGTTHPPIAPHKQTCTLLLSGTEVQTLLGLEINKTHNTFVIWVII